LARAQIADFHFGVGTQRFFAKQRLCLFAHWAGFLPSVEMTKNQVISSAGWYYKKAQFDLRQKMPKIIRAEYKCPVRAKACLISLFWLMKSAVLYENQFA
jgi:hypothetical protein